MKDKDKIRFAVRVFLCANKGKRYTSKQLSEFLNEFDLGGLIHNKKVIRRSKYKERLEPYLEELLKECNL